MSANILFISPALIKSRTGVSDAIDDKQLKPQIKVAQDMFIQPALGSTLYIRLQRGIENDNLTANESNLINNYITDALVWYTMSLLPAALSYQLFSKGVLQKTAEESNNPSRADLELLARQYKDTAEFYKTRLIGYLRENYLLFDEYFNTDTGLDVIFPEKKAYTCPIYLGDEYREDKDGFVGNISWVNRDANFTVEVTPAAGLSTFTVPELQGATTIRAVRGGLRKGITTTATADTQYIQVNGTTVTLPTGDLTNGELFIFEYR